MDHTGASPLPSALAHGAAEDDGERRRRPLPPPFREDTARAGGPPAEVIVRESARRLDHAFGTGGTQRLDEEFRMIKRPLLMRAFAEPNGPHRRGNLVMVSSSVPGEGKTFTAINLALSMTREKDIHVVLVDAALSRPGLAKALGLDVRPGLSELIEDTALVLGDVLHPTKIPKLSLIPAGYPHPTGTELLASQRARALIRELATDDDNRIVIFDTAPLLTSSEGSTLAHLMGQILLVVEAERTSELDLAKAVEMLGGCPNINLVLNRARALFGTRSKSPSQSGRQ